jgi:hypothetical protein
MSAVLELFRAYKRQTDGAILTVAPRGLLTRLMSWHQQQFYNLNSSAER